MLLCTSPSAPLKRAFAANKTSGFTAKTATLAEPVNDGVIDLARDGYFIPSAVKLTGVGVGAANDAFSVRIWGWLKVVGGGDKVIGSAATPYNVWLPFRIAEVGFILGTGAGVAQGVVPATELIADTVSIIATGEGTTTADTTRNGTIIVYSPASDISGFAIVPIVGFHKIEFDTDDTTNTPTMNVLYSLMGGK